MGGKKGIRKLVHDKMRIRRLAGAIAGSHEEIMHIALRIGLVLEMDW